MVCLDISTPFRSLVRVVGSGHDTTARATLLDLGRVSPLASSVNVGRLPSYLAASRPNPAATSTNTIYNNNKTLRLSGVVLLNRNNDKETRHQETANRNNSGETTTSQQRQNEEGRKEHGISTNTTHSTNTTTRTAKRGISEGCISLPPAKKQCIVLSSSSAAALYTKELLTQVETLRKENAMMKKRLGLFQELFRDKKRLKSVTRRICGDLIS